MAIHISQPTDLTYSVDLAKKHSDALGFIPRQAVENHLLTGHIRMARENGDPCGFFLTSGLQRQVRIFQACVQMDARGLDHAKNLLSDLVVRSAAAGAERITLHCRDELESNGFWSACGFTLASIIPG